MTNYRVAVIGLGSMGYGMAQSVLRQGHTTWGFDIAESQVKRFQDEGGESGAIEEIAGELDCVVLAVLNAAQTESVLFGENGVVPLLKSGSRGHIKRDCSARIRHRF